MHVATIVTIAAMTFIIVFIIIIIIISNRARIIHRHALRDCRSHQAAGRYLVCKQTPSSRTS